MFKDSAITQNEGEVLSIENRIQPKKMPKFKFKKPKDDADKAMQAFLTGKVAKFGKYLALPNALVYRTAVTPEGGGDMEVRQNVIAMKIERPEGPLFIGNSSILSLVGRGMAFGHETLNRGVTDIQTRLSQYIPMVPFSVFVEAGLNLTKIEILERGPEETIQRKETKYVKNKKVTTIETVHYTGASLFKVEDQTFLFDVDRREVNFKIFNPFLVKLAKPAKTIKAAYEALKPKEVVFAENQGLKVLRQGEWFFIPVESTFLPKQREIRWGDNAGKLENEPLELRAGQNRPNRTAMYSKIEGQTYVSGKVSHTGREHADLILKGWYVAVPNTSIESFTLTGDVD